MPQSVHSIMMSDSFFDLAATAVHAHTLATRKFESIHTTVHYAAQLALKSPLLEGEVNALLSEAQLSGPTRLHVIVKDRWYPTFKTAWIQHGKAAGRTLLVKECVYLLLAHFIVQGPQT